MEADEKGDDADMEGRERTDGSTSRKQFSELAPVPRSVSIITVTLIIVFFVISVQLSSLTEVGNHTYSQPFFTGVVLCSCNSIFYPMLVLARALYRSVTRSTLPSFVSPFVELRAEGIATKDLLTAASINVFCIIGISTTYFLSLRYISAAISIAVFNCSGIFVFAGSVLFLGLKPTIPKVLGVLLCISGVAAISIGSSDGGNIASSKPFLGVMFALAAGVLIAAMVLIQAFYLPSRKVIVAAIYLTTIGVFAFPFFLVVPVLSATKIYPFEWPSSGAFPVWAVMIVTSKFSNWSVIVSVGLTSPLYVAVGNMCAIPVSVLLQVFLDRFILDSKVNFSALTGLGMALICAGFLGLEVNWKEVLGKSDEHHDQDLEGHVNYKESASTAKKLKADEKDSLLMVGDESPLLPTREEKTESRNSGCRIDYRD